MGHSDADMAIPAVGVVILNYNCRDVLVECVRSVLEQTYPEIAVFVVDNGSEDGSVEAVRAAFSGVNVISTGRNIGFAGLNIGIRQALLNGCHFIMYLDSDTKLDACAVSVLADFLEKNPMCGIAGPLHLEFATGRPYFLGSKINQKTLASAPVVPLDLPTDCDWLGNAMARRQILQRIRFDERFFVYYSDIDLCLRVRKAGYRIFGVPAAKIYDMAGYTSSKIPGLRGYIPARNYLLLASKHAPRKCWPLIISLAVMYSVASSVRWLSTAHFRDASLVFVGLMSGLFMLLARKEPRSLRELAISGMRGMAQISGSASGECEESNQTLNRIG